MKAITAAAAVLLCSLPALAQSPATAADTDQSARTRVSNPPPMAADPNVVAPADTSSYPPGYQPTPPRAVLIPRTSEHARPAMPDGYQPAPQAAAQSNDDTVYQPATAATFQPISTGATRPRHDIDGDIVGDTPHAYNEAPVGTLFKVRIHQTVSTVDTRPGTPFTAEVIEPVMLDGRILIPTGTQLEGRVTEAHGGRRIHGTAALHLEPRRLILPDGTPLLVHAQVIDTDQNFATRIDSEGTILRRDHIKTTLAVLGAATGTSAVAGAMIGGGVGAVVGAGIGAGISTAWWLKQDRQTVLPQNTALVFSLNEPVTLGAPAR
jgi:hypothetical protein